MIAQMIENLRINLAKQREYEKFLNEQQVLLPYSLTLCYVLFIFILPE